MLIVKKMSEIAADLSHKFFGPKELEMSAHDFKAICRSKHIEDPKIDLLDDDQQLVFWWQPHCRITFPIRKKI